MSYFRKQESLSLARGRQRWRRDSSDTRMSVIHSHQMDCRRRLGGQRRQQSPQRSLGLTFSLAVSDNTLAGVRRGNRLAAGETTCCTNSQPVHTHSILSRCPPVVCWQRRPAVYY